MTTRIVTPKDVATDRNAVNGITRCSAYGTDGRRYSMMYEGYSLKESVRKFCRAVNTGELLGYQN